MLAQVTSCVASCAGPISFRASYRSLNKRAALCRDSLSFWRQPPAHGRTWSVLAKPAFWHPPPAFWGSQIWPLPSLSWCSGTAECHNLLTFRYITQGRSDAPEERHVAVRPSSAWSYQQPQPHLSRDCPDLQARKEQREKQSLPFLLKLGHRNA